MKKSTIIILFIFLFTYGCFKDNEKQVKTNSINIIDNITVDKNILDNSSLSEDGGVILNADVPENDGDGGDILPENK